MAQYFRNKDPIRGIDPDSLWVKKLTYFILVDSDQDIRVDYLHCKDRFYPVEPPAELHNEKAPD